MASSAFPEVAIHGAPHAHDASSVRRIMFTVVLAVTPCAGLGLWIYGWPALNLLLVTVGATLVFEAIALTLRGQDVARRLGDGSAVVAGLLLVLTLPPWAPWWLGVCGACIAMLLAKHPYGGIGQNLFNPAIVARVALLIAFPVEMTTWPEPLALGPRVSFADGLMVTFGSGIPDGMTGATLLAQFRVTGELSLPVMSHLTGVRFGSLGETSAGLIALGTLFLMWEGVISWHIPVGVLLGCIVPASVLWLVAPGPVLDPLSHLLSGGLLFTAVFIATDPASSPNSDRGKIVFGLGLGLVVFVIRSFCALPEGVGFAVLVMNALTPNIDRAFKPRVYGRSRKGAPLPAAKTLESKQ